MERKKKNAVGSYESYQPHLKPIDKAKGEKTRKINAWLEQHRKLVLGILVAVIILIGGALILLFSGLNFAGIPDTRSVQKKPAEKVYSPLTGAEISEADKNRVVTAVMIENSPAARPQSGLKQSGIVFEAIAEGGITRFLVLYQEDQPNIIGPVRSLRPYYVDWLAAFDPAVAHVGGSVNALKEIRNGNYKDIDQFSNAGAYWRATDRYAPHNVYTSFERLDQLNKSKGFTASQFTGFTRKDDPKKLAEQLSATQITVPISSVLYNSSYAYDAATNSYTRSQGGKPHLDRESGQIAPKVVVVIEANHSIVQEDGPREQIQTTGSGKAYIFQNGMITQGTWSKTGKKDQLALKDQSAKTIELNRGQTWITVVPTSKAPTWK